MDFQLQNQQKLETNENLEIFKSLLYPETLENSKLIGIFSEDLTFNLNDLYSHTEIRRLIQSEEQLISMIGNIDYIKVDKVTRTCHLNISDSFRVYSLINVPSNMEKEQLLNTFSIENSGILRIYKKYLIWTIIIDFPNYNVFEDRLNNICFGEEKVKYEVTIGKSLKESLVKRINYLKESRDLKAISEMNNSNSNGKNNDWRKRSSENEENFGKRVKKYSKADIGFGSNYGSNNSNSSKNNINNNYNLKRRRFNSDGASDNVIENPQKQNTKITMSLQIKYRYSIREMSEILQVYMKNIKEKPKFITEIPEICSSIIKKNINILGDFESKRDRSNTINFQAYEFKNKLNEGKKSIKLPKNNPLQNVDNIDFNNNFTNNNNKYRYSGKFDNFKSIPYGNFKNKFDFAN